ncbi:hypothetical protein [Pseudomonas phage vB_PaeM_PS119XW]|uniref:Uncharacterized protein n=1 Tax=Pseudomonas phage vB_PaeM_PS119XW TaxID=2601632 RepID=A0A5C1K777_9CAUD|nr:hypothetical protein PP933_gp001 [Pseudomonas phage vB_PaeM_PS119XW]QEM41730.1 hypothetical protein [Pseudomonas phage vB_PaeM_PS119XW]
MPYYQAILPLVEAHQWFKNGDHPMDRTVNGINEGAVVGRHISYGSVQGGMDCPVCNCKMALHGILKVRIDDSPSVVCPGDYIEFIRDDKKRILSYRLHHKKEFESIFEKVIANGAKK